MILVTGGSGHLGANLVRRLVAAREDVRVLVRRGSDNSALDGLDVQRVHGDLRDLPACEEAAKGCERVYHCAAKISTVGGGEREIWDSNVQGTQNILRAAREAGVKRVVVTSSFSAVGHVQGRPSDEAMPFYPFDAFMPYEWTKSLVELECLRAVADGLDVVIATSVAIVGPHDHKPSRMGRTLLDFANGRMPAYIDGGFEFVSAKDMVEGHLLCMEKGRTGHKYIFSTEFVSVGRLLDTFEEVTGAKRPKLKLPAPVMYGVASVTSPIMTRFFPNKPQRFTPAAVKLLTSGWRADTSKAQRELGFRPSTVAEAIREAYADFVRRGLVKNPRGVVAGPSASASASASATTSTSTSTSTSTTSLDGNVTRLSKSNDKRTGASA